MRYLYHVTKAERVPDILRTGLVPRAGANAMSAGDHAPGVYLCERSQAAVWARLLDAGAFLRVDAGKLDGVIVNTYDTLREYVTYGPIPPGLLSRCDEIPVWRREAARTCKSYVLCASDNIVTLLRELMGRKPDQAAVKALNATLGNVAGILERLPWEHANVRTILRAIDREGREGEYTMCDEYMGTGRKFWECLDDPQIPDGARLKAVLLDKLGPAFPALRTGGWEGPAYDA